MNTRNPQFKLCAMAVAVGAALASMSARADDEEAAALKTPTNTVEIGVVNVNDAAGKFGEYSGLNKSGAKVIGNFSVRGGDAYKGEGGTTRWSLTGKDLGLTSDSLEAQFSNQGRWKLGFGYDELRHNLSDSYQSPYLGAAGGNQFVLPTGFGTVANTTTGLTAGQTASFRNVNIDTTRRTTTFNGGLQIDRRWSLNFDYSHLDQTGSKLMGYGQAAIGGAAGESVLIVPNPTNYKTDTFKLSLNWVGEKAHMTGSYFSSFFRNGYDRVNFQTYGGANTMETMGQMPGNDFHQFSLAGGYNLSKTTKLTGSLSYSRNTQNDPYVYDAAMMLGTPPVSSLNGLIVSTHADLRLTDQTTRDLTLSAGFKYDERDNRTASNVYYFNSIALANGHKAYWPNSPISNKKDQLELAGDYRIKQDQHLRVAFTHEDVNRWCNQYATVSPPFAITGGVTFSYPAGTDCVVATGNKEDKLDATYRMKFNENLNFKVGYAYGKRNADFDPNAIVGFISTSANLTNPNAGGTTPGLNGGDFYGFNPFFDASRTQQVLKFSSNWQATEQLSLGVSARLTDDSYDATYGVQKGNSASLNLDATYAYRDDGSLSTYLTRQHRSRDLTDKRNNAASAASATAIGIPAASTWTNSLTDGDLTVGLGAKQGGLMGGKLELAGDLTYSYGRSTYATQLNWNGLTTAGVDCSNSALLSCGQLPTITSRMTQLKLTGTYKVDKSTKLQLGYLYQKLNATDYYYNGYQMGNVPNTLLPTNQQPGGYSASAIWINYIHNF